MIKAEWPTLPRRRRWRAIVQETLLLEPAQVHCEGAAERAVRLNVEAQPLPGREPREARALHFIGVDGNVGAASVG